MVCEGDCFLKASNATRPIQRDDASIVPYKLLEALQKFRATPHNSKCRYGERGAADAKPKAQIILDAAKVSAASGGNSEPKHDAGTATRHYRAFWQRRCRAAAAGAVLKPQGGNCAVLPYVFYGRYQYLLHIAAFTLCPKICTEFFLYPQSRGLALFCSASACLYIVRPPG